MILRYTVNYDKQEIYVSFGDNNAKFRRFAKLHYTPELNTKLWSRMPGDFTTISYGVHPFTMTCTHPVIYMA